MKDVLTVIMAGGRGTRLMPLTEDRSKPAVPFGGIYRLIDIPLSNCINSQLYKILIFPQYKSQSLVDHLEEGWNIFSGDLGHYLRIVAPQQRTGEQWYRGTADCVRQNLYLIEHEMPRHVLILSGDHVYKMDYSAFRDYHEKVEADVTVALLEVDRSQGSEFGIAEVDDNLRIRAWEEKPKEPKPIPDDPERCLASMGIYLFRTDLLLDLLHKTDYDDFGKDIIPRVIDESENPCLPLQAHEPDFRLYPPGGPRRGQEAAPGGSDPRLAVLEGCGYTRLLLERQHGFDRRGPFLQPLWVSLACQDPPAPVPAGQVRFQRPRAYGAEDRDCSGFTGFTRLHNKRRDRKEFGAFLGRNSPKLGAG